MKIKRIGPEQELSNGTFKHVIAADHDEMAEKCAAVMNVLVEQTNTPEEGIIILVTLLEVLKKEAGVVQVQVMEVMEGPPS